MSAELLKKYLQDKHFFDEQKWAKLQEYFIALKAENEVINLVSRKTTDEELWTQHFWDSLLVLGRTDFSNKKILDFGTGGGFPGIPIAIMFPESKITLLDSINKKINALKRIVKNINLENCEFICSRIEDLDRNETGKYDLILCRSVRILPEFKRPLLQLLKYTGKLVLFKSKNLDDLEQFLNKKIIDVSRPEIGERKIIIIGKK